MSLNLSGIVAQDGTDSLFPFVRALLSVCFALRARKKLFFPFFSSFSSLTTKRGKEQSSSYEFLQLSQDGRREKDQTEEGKSKLNKKRGFHFWKTFSWGNFCAVLRDRRRHKLKIVLFVKFWDLQVPGVMRISSELLWLKSRKTCKLWDLSMQQIFAVIKAMKRWSLPCPYQYWFAQCLPEWF